MALTNSKLELPFNHVHDTAGVIEVFKLTCVEIYHMELDFHWVRLVKGAGNSCGHKNLQTVIVALL